ncbi:MAG TPA: TraR/DksA C4-type zinc finger protein [Actinomycetota bacterium]|nr:TraR/DksA C4-type zinc finger protein [Actinomycetota bacterium]
MARKKSAGAAAATGADARRERRSAGSTASAGPASAGAEPAPRPRGHRSLVTKRDLQGYRRRLEAELAELRGQRADLEESTEASLADATGEVGFDEEFADAGSFTFERERDLSLVDNAKDLIDKVERALGRIGVGTFGRCEACGGAIEAERLDALPYTTLCLADARQRVRLR